jgi:hypothetical protein
MGFLTGSLHQDGGVFFMLFGMGLMYPILAALIKSEGKHFSNGVRS